MVFYEKVDGCVMYVLSFGGFVKDKDWWENEKKFIEVLERDGKGYVKNMYIVVGYDLFFWLFGCYNEVLFVVDF